MKKLISGLFVLLFASGCMAQQVVKFKGLKYIGFAYQGTSNKSYVNKRIKFFDGKDTVFFNLKLPFDTSNNNIYDQGIYYNCTLKNNVEYSFELKKVTADSIPKEYSSYYFTNTKFLSGNKFIDVRKDTPYTYRGEYGKFVDVNNELYLIVKMTPAGDCIMQH